MCEEAGVRLGTWLQRQKVERWLTEAPRQAEQIRSEASRPELVASLPHIFIRPNRFAQVNTVPQSCSLNDPPTILFEALRT